MKGMRRFPDGIFAAAACVTVCGLGDHVRFIA